MPELPEVEVVRRGLGPHAVGRTIIGVEIRDPRSARRQAGGASGLEQMLVGTTVTAIARRGKFLWWRLADPDGADTGHALMTHLGMSGQLRVRSRAAVPAHDAASPGAAAPDAAPPDVDLPADLRAPAPSEGPASDPVRHLRIRLALDDGAHVDFIDQRLFGGLWTSPLVTADDGRTSAWGSPDDLLPRDAAHIARDVLDDAADLPAIARAIRRRRAPVKSLLLAQDLVSGIGNIYADEALWAARAHHATPGQALSQVRAHRILRACRAVMERALAVGGTSFDALYVNVDGRSGYFARSLEAYGREGEPCSRCGTTLRRQVRSGRSCFFCPRCQRRR